MSCTLFQLTLSYIILFTSVSQSATLVADDPVHQQVIQLVNTVIAQKYGLLSQLQDVPQDTTPTTEATTTVAPVTPGEASTASSSNPLIMDYNPLISQSGDVVFCSKSLLIPPAFSSPVRDSGSYIVRCLEPLTFPLKNGTDLSPVLSIIMQQNQLIANAVIQSQTQSITSSETSDPLMQQQVGQPPLQEAPSDSSLNVQAPQAQSVITQEQQQQQTQLQPQAALSQQQQTFIPVPITNMNPVLDISTTPAPVDTTTLRPIKPGKKRSQTFNPFARLSSFGNFNRRTRGSGFTFPFSQSQSQSFLPFNMLSG